VLCGFLFTGTNFLLNPPKGFVLFIFKVVVVLKVEPELRARAEVFRKPERSVGRYRAFAVDDLVYAPGRHMDIRGHPVLAESQGLYKLFQKDLAGMNIWYFSFNHDSTPYGNQQFLRHGRCYLSIGNRSCIACLSGSNILLFCRLSGPQDSCSAVP
jgi:hypothetical protein